MFAPNSLNFLTRQFSIPPVAPVIKIFLFLSSSFKFLISVIELIEKHFASFNCSFYHSR